MNYVASGDTDKPHDGLSSGCTPQKGAERHVAENSEFGVKKSSSQYRLSLTSSVIWDKLLNLPKSVGVFFFISKMKNFARRSHLYEYTLKAPDIFN